jgi:hypothetical protein
MLLIMKLLIPKVIIQPKSIIGFIPLKTKDKKAHIVVKNSIKNWKHHFFTSFKNSFIFLLIEEILFLIVKILQLHEYSLPYLI